MCVIPPPLIASKLQWGVGDFELKQWCIQLAYKCKFYGGIGGELNQL